RRRRYGGDLPPRAHVRARTLRLRRARRRRAAATRACSEVALATAAWRRHRHGRTAAGWQSATSPPPCSQPRATAKRHLLDPIRAHALRGLLGSLGSGLSSRRLTHESRPRGLACRNPLGSLDHAQLLSDGLHLLLI